MIITFEHKYFSIRKLITIQNDDKKLKTTVLHLPFSNYLLFSQSNQKKH